MALTITEMNYIQQGIVRPLGSTLFDMVATQAMRHAFYLRDNFKVIAPEDTDALSYISKSNRTISKINNRDSAVFNSLLTTIIHKFGNTSNLADLRVYSDSQWETLLGSHISTTFEIVSDITTAEADAYNNA